MFLASVIAMLGVLLSCRGLHSLAEMVFAYPHTMYQDHLSYYDSVHKNMSLSAVSTLANARVDQKECILGLSCAVIADLLCPKSELCDKTLDITVELVRFIGYPVLTETFEDKRLQRRPSRTFGFEVKPKPESGEQLISFDVAFALDAADSTVSKGENLKEALRAFSAYLKYEETRDCFLTREIAKIKQIVSGRQDHESAICDAIDGSKLAHHLRALLLNLRDTGEARLFLNDWLCCVISLNFLTELPALKMHQTLLLLDIPQKITEQLPLDSSPVLLSLIHALKLPVKSLEELRLELCLSEETVLSAAQHLIMWQKARAVNVLSQASLIVTNPEGLYTPRLEGLFGTLLRKKIDKSGLSLVQFLSKFEQPTAIKDLISTDEVLKVKDYIGIVTWMMRHNLLTECRARVYIQHSKLLDPIMAAAVLASGNAREAYGQYLETLPKGKESYPVLERLLLRGSDHCDAEDFALEEQFSVAEVYQAVNDYSDILMLVKVVL